MVGELTWSRRLVGLWLPLTLLFVFALFPFAWMAATSLKANAELYDPTANPLWIRHPSLVHYIDLFKETNFVVWIGNTMLVATVSTVISLLLGVMLAYPLARMRFPAAGLLAITVAVTYLVPQTLLFVPMADLINRMKLGDTLTAVMLTYPTLLVPFCAWLLIGYFKTVRSEEHTSELQSLTNLVCRLLLEKKKQKPHQSERVQRVHAVPPIPQGRPRADP